MQAGISVARPSGAQAGASRGIFAQRERPRRSRHDADGVVRRFLVPVSAAGGAGERRQRPPQVLQDQGLAGQGDVLRDRERAHPRDRVLGQGAGFATLRAR